MKTYYYLYQITNLVNAKIYVGVHKTRNLNDGYMGSGKVIRSAIEKYGIENFQKDILEFFDTSEAMYAREKEVVTDEFLLREDTYNLRRGGTGGFDYINSVEKNKHIGKNNYFFNNQEVTNKGTTTRNKKLLDLAYKESYHKKISESLRGRIGSFTGKQHTEKTKMLMSTKAKQRTANSQDGTCWVWHDLVGNKKIKKDMLPLYIDQGWSKGRRMKVQCGS